MEEKAFVGGRVLFLAEQVSAGSNWFLLHASDWPALLISFS